MLYAWITNVQSYPFIRATFICPSLYKDNAVTTHGTFSAGNCVHGISSGFYSVAVKNYYSPDNLVPMFM